LCPGSLFWNKRSPPRGFNGVLREALAALPPPAVSGRRIKINYITHPKTRPPTFVLFTTGAEAVPEQYRRYLVNSLRQAFDLPGVCTAIACPPFFLITAIDGTSVSPSPK